MDMIGMHVLMLVTFVIFTQFSSKKIQNSDLRGKYNYENTIEIGKAVGQNVVAMPTKETKEKTETQQKKGEVVNFQKKKEEKEKKKILKQPTEQPPAKPNDVNDLTVDDINFIPVVEKEEEPVAEEIHPEQIVECADTLAEIEEHLEDIDIADEEYGAECNEADVLEQLHFALENMNVEIPEELNEEEIEEEFHDANGNFENLDVRDNPYILENLEEEKEEKPKFDIEEGDEEI